MSDSRQSPIPQDRVNENTDQAQRANDDQRRMAEQDPAADPDEQPGLPEGPTSPAEGGD